MKNLFERFKNWYRKLPEKKIYIEFITALLSIPVLLTVIILNLNNLNQQKNNIQTQTNNNKITPIQIIITGGPSSGQGVNGPSSTPVPCIKTAGPVSIISPQEGEVVVKNPVCITIATQTNYCPVVWSYNLDGGSWSDFTNNDICLSGLANGNRTIQLKIKSTASTDQITLQRSFIYQGNIISPTAMPTSASASAGL